jgi:hypothetical protein
VEADWEIELGGGAPVIDVSWQGFVDLRRSPEKASELAEVLMLPALAPVLVRLNSPHSFAYSVKCDVWPITEIDPLEFDAPQELAAHGMAVYLDLVPCDPTLWTNPDKAIPWCRTVSACLKSMPLRCCRIDLVIRRAMRTPEPEDGIGITVYLAACGPAVEAAATHLESVLAVFADSIEPGVQRGPAHSTLQ